MISARADRAEIVVLTGLDFEARGLARELEAGPVPDLPVAAYGRGGLSIVSVGLRAACLAERWAQLALLGKPALIVSAGTCGALAPELQSGALIIPESVLTASGERFNVTPGAHAQAVEAARASGLFADTGLLLTSLDVVATPEDKARTWQQSGACAADLESALILALAVRSGCRSLVVRGVTDTATQKLPPELVGVVTPQGRLSPGRALALAFARPTTIRHALAFRRDAGLALKSVARLIAALAG